MKFRRKEMKRKESISLLRRMHMSRNMNLCRLLSWIYALIKKNKDTLVLLRLTDNRRQSILKDRRKWFCSTRYPKSRRLSKSSMKFATMPNKDK
jgi:hypothetical protein